jgi:hypothetical protein
MRDWFTNNHVRVAAINRSRMGVFVFAAMALLLVGPNGDGGPGVSSNDFTAEGVIAGNFFGANGVLRDDSSQDSFSFSSRSDGAWSITLYRKGKTNDFSVVTFDGRNEYAVCYNEYVRSASGYTSNTVPISQNLNIGFISEGGYPRYCDYNARIIWLALGSGRYLSQIKSNGIPATMPLPWYNEQYDLRAYGSSLAAESFERPPGLPSRIEFKRTMALDLDDAAELKRTGVNRATSQAVSDYQPESLRARKQDWKEGFVAGLYVVEETTNYGNIEIPMKFECIGFDPRWGKLPMCNFVGVVTNIHEMSPNLPFQPPILGHVAVHDARFRFLGLATGVDGISYTLSPGDSWPSRGIPGLVGKWVAVMVAAIILLIGYVLYLQIKSMKKHSAASRSQRD